MTKAHTLINVHIQHTTTPVVVKREFSYGATPAQ